MPGPVSESFKGTPDWAPYVPSWCYKNNNPPLCSCGHHHGYHDDGQCLHKIECNCKGYQGAKPDDF